MPARQLCRPLPRTMPEVRAKEVAKLLIGAGLPRAAIDVSWSAEVAQPPGDGDWRAR